MYFDEFSPQKAAIPNQMMLKWANLMSGSRLAQKPSKPGVCIQMSVRVYGRCHTKDELGHNEQKPDPFQGSFLWVI